MEELFPDFNPEKDHCFDCFRGEKGPCDGCPVRETFRDGEKHSRVEFSEKTGRWLELNSYPIRDPRTGEVDRVLEFVQDITEQRNRETELEDREHFLSAILNASNDGIVAVSDVGRETHLNTRLIEMFDGAGPEFWSNDTEKVRAMHRKLNINSEDIYKARDRNRETGEPAEGTLSFHDGRIYQWRLTSIKTGGDQTDYTRIWTFHDATEETRTARRIAESEEYLRTLFETMPSGLGIYRAVRDETGAVDDFLYVNVNKAFEEMIGVDRKEIEEQSPARLFPQVRVVSDVGKGTDLVSINQEALDGTPRSYLVHDPLRNTYQRIVAFRIGPDRVGTFVVDETARIASERALRESEEKYRTLFNRMPNGLALFDVVRDEAGRPVEFRYAKTNPALEKINGLSSEAMRGKNIMDVLPDSIRLISEDYQRIDPGDHWMFELGRAAMRGESGTYLTHSEQNGTYHRLTVFSPGPGQLGAFVTDETALISASRSLKESEQKINSLFNSMSNGLLLLDVVRDTEGKPVDYIVSSCNSAYAKYFGMPEKDVIGLSFLKSVTNLRVLSHDFGDRWWTGIEIAAQGITGTYHVYHVSPFSPPYQEVVVFPCGENQVGLLTYDETYRVRSERQLQLMQLIIDRISHPVFWLYLDGTVQYANDAAAVAWGFESSGITPDGPIGDKVWLYDTSVTPEKWQEFLDRFKDANDRQFDTVMRRKGGTVFPAVVTVSLLEQKGAPFFAATFQDLTEQTRRIKAEQQALAKSSFLDHMSHEIRTPLNGVLGIADLMLETDLNAKQREYVEMARISGQQLLSIVTNILDYSIIDDGELELKDEEVDLPELVESLRKVVLSMTAERESGVALDVAVHPEVPHYILGDAARLRQIIFNLLDNALKFTHEGRVTLDVAVAATMPATKFSLDSMKRSAETTERFLAVTVTDTGIGITDEMIDALFDAFTMGDASFSRKYGGTGLGLPIARGLVHIMGGEVYVESKVGAGSEFRFLIPLREPEHREEEPDRTAGASVETPRREPGELTILVVEDNRINRIVTGEILKNAGYKYEFAEDGLQACRAVPEKKFDLILMDCQMPVMDGFEATRRIRQMEAGTDEWRAAHSGRIPIIALTANALVGDEQNCLDAGMDGFCGKPANSEQLIKIIRQWTAAGEP